MLAFPKTVYIKSMCSNNQLIIQYTIRIIKIQSSRCRLVDSYFYFRIILQYSLKLLLSIVIHIHIVTEIQCGECLCALLASLISGENENVTLFCCKALARCFAPCVTDSDCHRDPVW